MKGVLPAYIRHEIFVIWCSSHRRLEQKASISAEWLAAQQNFAAKMQMKPGERKFLNNWQTAKIKETNAS